MFPKMTMRNDLRALIGSASAVAGSLVFSILLAALLLLPLSRVAAVEELRFGSDRTSISFAEGKERTFLSGNAWIRSDSMYIQADEIELYGDDFRFAVCRGNLSVTDDEQGIYLTAEQLFFDRELELSRAEGNALMEDRKNEVVVKGGFLEHRSEEDLTLIQVGVRILGEDLTTRSEFARYRRDTEILELSGLPVVFYKGDEYRATRITIDLESDEITLSRGVEGRITTGDDEPDDEPDDASGDSGTPENGGTPQDAGASGDSGAAENGGTPQAAGDGGESDE
jgi:lipopolysaccharide export system protein LptA